MRVWKDIVGYEGHYQVSNLGDIRSVDRQVVTRDGKRKFNKGCNIVSQPSPKGYRHVGLCRAGSTVRYLVHRIVADAFIEKQVGRDFVNHKDGNKANNCVENLEWVSAKENINHAIETGLIERNSSQYANLRKPVHCVELNMDFESIAEAVAFLKHHGHNAARDSKISECASGKRRSAYGLTWKEFNNEAIYS